MCGIAGKLNLTPDEPVDPQVVVRMVRALVHRGPDDEGFYFEAPVGMGMRRLSIIDLTTGRQPVSNEDGTIWTIFNGEIYNFRELRAALEARGHVFVTGTDTEVIVHLYEDHGEDFVVHLAGMFAIAVWDARARRLVLARDRLGIKPLYYHANSHRLVFASELKAILMDGEIQRRVDLQALDDYLSLNYVPGPRTIFADIKKLPPGHLLISVDGGFRVRPYWQLHCGDPAPGRARWREEAWTSALDDLLRSVVGQHLVSDVPLGVFLSGGLDSSALVAYMASRSSEPVNTFSIGFDEASYDELADARRVARAFGTVHHETVVRADAAHILPELVRAFDEPFADSSAIPVYCVSQLARRHVTVALSGEGGDEVFAGYHTYAAYKLARWYNRLPTALRRHAIPGVVRRLPVSHRRVSFDYKAKHFLEGAGRPPAEAHYWWKVIFSPDAKAALWARGGDGLEDALRLYQQTYEHCGASDPLARLQHIDLAIYLPDDLLVKADRMSMAHSLEVRVPFVDHRVVEFAASLPGSLKLNGLTKKYILRRLMNNRLPRAVVHGAKRGFNVPVPAWLRRELRDLVHDVLSPARLRDTGLFDPGVVSTLIGEHEQMRHDWSRNIWGLLIFQLWHDDYVRPACDRSPAVSGREPPRVACADSVQSTNTLSSMGAGIER